MGLGMAIALFLLGLLAATDFVVARIPATEKLLEAIKPNRGWFGLGFAVWGVYILLFGVLFNFGFMSVSLLGWLTYLICGALLLGVGFLVGFEKIAEVTGKGQDLEPLREKLAPHMRNMGLLSLAMSVWALLGSLILW